MIAAGRMRERITILGSVATSNPLGEETHAWAAQTTVWAARELLTLREVNRQAGLQEAADGKFVIRKLAGVTTENQIEHDGTRYDITSVEAWPDNSALTLLVKRA